MQQEENNMQVADIMFVKQGSLCHKFKVFPITSTRVYLITLTWSFFVTTEWKFNAITKALEFTIVGLCELIIMCMPILSAIVTSTQWAAIYFATEVVQFNFRSTLFIEVLQAIHSLILQLSEQ